MPEYRDDMTDRPYEPTALRLAEARRRGVVPRSGDLAAAATLLGGAAAVGLIGEHVLRAAVAMTARLLDGRAGPLASPDELAGEAWTCVGPLLVAAAPVLAVLVGAAVLSGIGQVGLLATAEPIRPKAERVSPGAGRRRLLDGRSWVRGGFAAGKLAAVCLVAAWTLHGDLPRIAAAGGLDAAAIASVCGGCVHRLCLRVAASLLVLGALDYVHQWFRHRQDLRMSRREWLEDMKRMEADDRIKRRRRVDAAEAVPTRGLSHV